MRQDRLPWHGTIQSWYLQVIIPVTQVSEFWAHVSKASLWRQPRPRLEQPPTHPAHAACPASMDHDTGVDSELSSNCPL